MNKLDYYIGASVGTFVSMLTIVLLLNFFEYLGVSIIYLREVFLGVGLIYLIIITILKKKLKRYKR